ncbi:MAG TPA: TraR/DksA C4-type zinc finger protein [Blastocatellia bacterium]|nr:TraR/DksA C4-type zinc finger protein [Blastocatellia bacterium]
MPRNDDFLNPPITPYGKCHTCGEKILFGAERCPNCGIEIDHEEVFPSAFNYFVITQAISSANNLRTLDIGVILLIVVSLIRFVFEYGLWFTLITSLPWLFLLLRITQWFRQHGNWECSDPEYLEARERMRWSLKLWIAANAFNAIVILAVHLKGALIPLE